MVVARGMFHKGISAHILNVRSAVRNEALARLPMVETAWAVLRRQNTATMCACPSVGRHRVKELDFGISSRSLISSEAVF